MAIERVTIEDRDSWLRWRLENINASEVAIALGEGAWGSAAELYAEKKGLKVPRDDNPTLRKGRWLEAGVFKAVREYCPSWQLAEARIYLRDRERRLGATPDALALRPDREGRGVIQAKVISRGKFKRAWLVDDETSIEEGDAEVPIYYRLQTLTEMRLAECQWGVIAVLVDSEFAAWLRIFEIERDMELEASILAGVESFWRDHFDRNIPPPYVPQRDAALIKQLHPREDGTTIDLTGHNRVLELVDELVAHRQIEATSCKAKEIAATELQGLLGDHSYAKLADGRALSWRSQTRPAKMQEAKTFRVLRVHKRMPKQADEDDDE